MLLPLHNVFIVRSVYHLRVLIIQFSIRSVILFYDFRMFCRDPCLCQLPQDCSRYNILNTAGFGSSYIQQWPIVFHVNLFLVWTTCMFYLVFTMIILQQKKSRLSFLGWIRDNICELLSLYNVFLLSFNRICVTDTVSRYKYFYSFRTMSFCWSLLLLRLRWEGTRQIYLWGVLTSHGSP